MHAARVQSNRGSLNRYFHLSPGRFGRSVCLILLLLHGHSGTQAISIAGISPGDSIVTYMAGIPGGFNTTLYRQILGAANEFKEGDSAIGVAAEDERTRELARSLISRTKVGDITGFPLLADRVGELIGQSIDPRQYATIRSWTMGELKDFILSESEEAIKGIMPGLDSDVIGCLVKLMTNDELILAGRKIFNPLPGSTIGARGYLGARIQPNSPTDNPEDIIWQVFNGFSFATGDVVLGTNPVDGTPGNILRIENALRDIVVTFGLEGILPWSVLSHIDTQREIADLDPGKVSLMFQSLAGTDAANAVFGTSVEKMLDHARSRKGQKFGLYIETGQGSEFTNGASEGVDMVILESRKYGFVRALRQELAKVQPGGEAWVIVNDVAGFIGPEVFRTREQLVRCCLEDIVMGKLHGLPIGLDICSTLHMSVSLQDLDWCMDRILPANPAYLMALPTKNDPMLSYLTTAFQDHVRLRSRFGFRIDDRMKDFFVRTGILDTEGNFTEHAGDPVWMYYQYRLAKGDLRSREEIRLEGEARMARVQARDVPLAIGHGPEVEDMNPELAGRIQALYEDAKRAIWTRFDPGFIAGIPGALTVNTLSKDREQYMARPETGEKLDAASMALLEGLRLSWGDRIPDIQIIISEGLNANSIMAEGHLAPCLDELRKGLEAQGRTVSARNIVVPNGRVRAGYRIGEILFRDTAPETPKGIVYLIGERPGTGQNAFSIYLAAPKGRTWSAGMVDHDIAKVVSGISLRGTTPREAARQTIRLLDALMR